MAEAKRDNNRVPTLLAVSSADLTTPAKVAVDPATGRLLVTATVTAGATTATEYTEGDTDTSFSGIMLLGEGPNNTATPFAVDASGNQSVTVAAGTAVIGAAIPSGHATAGTGLSTVFDADGDNTAQAIKAGAGRLFFLEVSNPNSADAYIQIFDVATGGVTVGTTTPKLSFLVPAGDGTKDGAMDKVFTIPIHFGTAITYACTTTATGNGDPTIGLIVNAGYV